MARPDLYRTGNAGGPAPLRVGIDIAADANGDVGPTVPPQGISTFDDVNLIPTKGHIWKLAKESPLPQELQATPDPPPPGHWVIGPAVGMSLAALKQMVEALPWVSTGQKKR
jgi:hypothetical protein